MATQSVAVRGGGVGLVGAGWMPGKAIQPPRWNPSRLTSIREALGVSPERVAELVNKHLDAKISGRKVRRWEEGTYTPNALELVALCNVFHVGIERFFSAD